MTTRRPTRCGAGLLVRTIAWAALVAVAAPAKAEDEAAGASDILVTAERREQAIDQVPISITAYSADLMDRQGIRRIDDIARLTPGLRFVRTAGVAGNNGANIAIRGIASDVGSATTAIYIDETPIQIRSVGYFGGNPYPRVFDLDRVEVLRGPQGTLFGAGAEGGAVRFLTPQPSFDAFDVYGRAEVSGTEHGAPSFEAGMAVGGPVSETIAVRASGWHRRDGGYIDRVRPQTTDVIQKDINAQDSTSARLALSWRPIETLTITPSIFTQTVTSEGRDQYWEVASAIGDRDYRTGISNREPTRDRFFLPALKIDYQIGGIALISNTSFFDRRQRQVLDYINYQSFLRTGDPFGSFANKDPANATATVTTAQENFTQELRLQSFDADGPIDWTLGGIYSRTKQRFTNFSASGRIPGVISSGFPQYLGRYNLYELVVANDEQFAGFASIDIKPIDSIRITLGGRYTRNRFDFRNTRDGPVNGGRERTIRFDQEEGAFTPRIAATWQVDGDTMLYASASKGFRPGGAQPIVDPNFCAADLAALGVVDSPSNYRRDSLWSTEIGAKGALAGGALQFDINAYQITWKSIQQAIRLPNCGFTFIGNLGDTTARGLDLQLVARPAQGIQIGTNIGYSRNSYDADVFFDGDRSDANPGILLRRKSQRLGGPNWAGTVFTQIDRPLSGTTEGYVRADYAFAGKGIIPAVQGTFGFDANLPAIGRTDHATLRAGIRFSGIDISAFVDNLANSTEPLSRSHDGVASTLYYAESYRPRTFGLTMRLRQ